MKVHRILLILASAIMLAGAAIAQQRSDAEIRADLQRRIGPGTGVTVALENGIVTLTGTVSNLAQRQSIVNLARRTIGVREVVDRITAVPAQRRSDEEIARSVSEALARNLSREEVAAITVRVENGVVILTGTLSSSYPKQVAGALASWVPGVIDIRNEIVVRPREVRTDAQILSDVKSRFERNPVIPTGRITVTVANGVVTLTGVVDKLVQVEQAEAVARFTPGVIDVRNDLFVNG